MRLTTTHSTQDEGILSVGRLRARNREGEALLSDKTTETPSGLEELGGPFCFGWGTLHYDVLLTRIDHLMIVRHHSLEFENGGSMRWRRSASVRCIIRH
jgi:hypothetical protein